MIMTDEQIKQAAIERGCIDGTAEYYGFIEGAQYYRAHQPNPWISVKERLPEESKKHKGWLSDTVFVATNRNDGTSARYDHATKTWCPAKILQGKITRWMPIPQIAKGE